MLDQVSHSALFIRRRWGHKAAILAGGLHCAKGMRSPGFKESGNSIDLAVAPPLQSYAAITMKPIIVCQS
jgi:hypothetical protein